MPSGIPNGSAAAVDYALRHLAKAVNDHVADEAAKGHVLHAQTIKKRLLLAIRHYDILPKRRPISSDDDFQGLMDPPSFSASEGRFEPWYTPKAPAEMSNDSASTPAS